VCKDKQDDFTLDTDAFLSALSSAHTHAIVPHAAPLFMRPPPWLRVTRSACVRRAQDFVWLDAWAYRQQPPWGDYDHPHFCATLAHVMLRVNHVIWLPRSRKSAHGEYQYRIWCTFEATMVALRDDVTVSMAGHAPSFTQLRLASAGGAATFIFSCSFPAMTTLSHVNLGFFCILVSVTFYYACLALLDGAASNLWHLPLYVGFCRASRIHNPRAARCSVVPSLFL
jgi:hypothetical protein